MKIVAGKYGGRRLLEPQNRDIRPTSDKVRGAIFNMLASRGALEDACVLDAFCGTGALGLEALSRGAKHCEFMDKSRTSLALARKNVDLLGEQSRASYVLGDARKMTLMQNRCRSDRDSTCVSDPKLVNTDKACANGTEEHKKSYSQYNLVFLDPPYHKGLIMETLVTLMDAERLYDGAWIACESEKELSINSFGQYRLDGEKTYGDTKVVLLNYSQINTL